MDVSNVEAGEVTMDGQPIDLYPDLSVYYEITTVELEAIPFEGWWFDHWTEGNPSFIDRTSFDNPMDVRVYCNLNVTANFVEASYKTVTPAGAKAMIDAGENNLIVIDVREDYEYCNSDGHIPGSLNYPWASGVLSDRYAELPMESDILVVCRSGNRSKDAASFLAGKGYRNIYEIGGMNDWEWETMTCDNIIYYPHIASNGTWETEICVISTSDTQTVNGVFKAYDNAGVFVSEIDDVTLAPHGRREITVGDEFTDPADIGYIVFESNSSAIEGYTKFYIEGKYRVAIPAVSKINTGDIYISHIASNSSWGTGVSLLNTTSSPRTLTIEFDNGQTRTVDLLANEHKAFLIKSLFGGAVQPDTYSAVIKGGSGVVGLELFSNRNQMSGILLKDTTTDSIYYPHTMTEDGWGTGIVAYNPSDTDCALIITPYNAAGVALAPAYDTIGGNEHYIGLASDLGLPLDTAWLKIDAASPITGFELFAKTNLLGGYTGVGIAGNQGVFAKLETDGSTTISFANIEAVAAAVTLTAYDDGGAVKATETINLDVHEKAVNTAEDIFAGDDISTATYITYSSDRKIVGFQLNVSSDGMLLDVLPALGAH